MRSGPGRRRAEPSRRARRSRRWFVPGPAVAGATALIIAGIGAVVVSSGAGGSASAVSHAQMQPLSMRLGDVADRSAPVESGDVGSPSGDPVPRISRGVDRTAIKHQTTAIKHQTEVQAQQRMQALADLAKLAQARADELRSDQRARARQRSDQWVLPVAGYTITATFGETSYLWSSVHTGLDFAAAEGTPIVAVAGGTVTSTDYDGAYGNKTVVTLDDGTEIWYCHQSSQLVSVGDVVTPGQTIGAVGSTGNTTGPHLHLEVRPNGGDPVDPYATLVEHGVNP